MFFWTPPHFWALAIKYADDYRAANVPMLPAVVPFEHAVRQMIGHTIAMIACTLLLIPVADLGALYSVAAVVLGALFLASTIVLAPASDPGDVDARVRLLDHVRHGPVRSDDARRAARSRARRRLSVCGSDFLSGGARPVVFGR